MKRTKGVHKVMGQRLEKTVGWLGTRKDTAGGERQLDTRKRPRPKGRKEKEAKAKMAKSMTRLVGNHKKGKRSRGGRR